MMLDINKVREDTPGCHDKLFFNSAGSSLPPKAVTASMIDYLKEEEQVGGYLLAAQKEAEIKAAYLEVAKMLNTTADNIAITYNATDSYARALSAIPFVKGDTILTTTQDYVSNQIQFLSLQKRSGVKVVRVPGSENGDLDLDAFEQLFKAHRPKLVAVTHVPTSSGLIQDVNAIGRLCAQVEDCYFLVDACQSVGQLIVDVEAIQCDFLSATTRKFLRGPRGCGFLYVSDKVLQSNLEPLFLDLYGADWVEPDQYLPVSSAQRFELWEFQYANVVGLKEAARYANELSMPLIEKAGLAISGKLREALRDVAGITILDKGTHLSNIITLRKEGVGLVEMESHLKQHGVYFSVGQARNALLDARNKGVDWFLRISPHYFNTQEEAERLMHIVDAM
ncbi:MAG: aminotransferase class V-fold PLP-dependent enzyme [Cytophagales bacterium]|nr:aminotransferase class V-fold PLP-dependent enzyme [Cytophagales bacterium]